MAIPRQTPMVPLHCTIALEPVHKDEGDDGVVTGGRAKELRHGVSGDAENPTTFETFRVTLGGSHD
jgi:hypothetical protein